MFKSIPQFDYKFASQVQTASTPITFNDENQLEKDNLTNPTKPDELIELSPSSPQSIQARATANRTAIRTASKAIRRNLKT